jgi:hypothetical protein
VKLAPNFESMPINAKTDASYSATVKRRIRAGNVAMAPSVGPPPAPPVPVVPPDPDDPPDPVDPLDPADPPEPGPPVPLGSTPAPGDPNPPGGSPMTPWHATSPTSAANTSGVVRARWVMV